MSGLKLLERKGRGGRTLLEVHELSYAAGLWRMGQAAGLEGRERIRWLGKGFIGKV